MWKILFRAVTEICQLKHIHLTKIWHKRKTTDNKCRRNEIRLKRPTKQVLIEYVREEEEEKCLMVRRKRLVIVFFFLISRSDYGIET